MIVSDDKRFRIKDTSSSIVLLDEAEAVYELDTQQVAPAKAVHRCKEEAEFLSDLPWRLSWIEA